MNDAEKLVAHIANDLEVTEGLVARAISALCDGLGITEELVTNLDHAACGCNCSLNCGIWCPVCATVATLRTLLDARGPSDE